MSAEALLQELQSRGVHLVPEGENIRYRARRGVLTAELGRRIMVGVGVVHETRSLS